MRVLVTGGAGYVGSILVPHLLNLGHKVVVYDLYIYGDTFQHIKKHPNLTEIRADIRDKDQLTYASRNADQLIHLACISNDPSFDLNPVLGRSINRDAFINIMDATRTNNIHRLIFASSASSYGIKGCEVTEEVEQEPLTDYAIYKAECERLLEESNINYTVIRPATVCGYGPRLRLDLVVNLLTVHALINKKIKIIGENLLRPNINIYDMARVYSTIMKAPDILVGHQVFNAGFENMSIRAIADLVIMTLNDPEIIMENIPTDDIRSYHLNSDKIKRVLGFKPAYSVKSAIISLNKAFKNGVIVDGLNNPLYWNIKRMQQLKLK